MGVEERARSRWSASVARCTGVPAAALECQQRSRTRVLAADWVRRDLTVASEVHQ